jgi:hypothetical protein
MLKYDGGRGCILLSMSIGLGCVRANSNIGFYPVCYLLKNDICDVLWASLLLLKNSSALFLPNVVAECNLNRFPECSFFGYD